MNSVCHLCKCVVKDNTLFSDLSDKQIERFKDVITLSLHKKKDVIFWEGDPCCGFHIVKSGRVKIIRTSKDGKEQILKIAEPGEIIGMEVFYDEKEYTNTAAAMDECELCFVEKTAFFKILEEYPVISKKIIIALSKELKTAYDKIGEMGLKTAKEKMAHLLSTLAKDYGVQKDGRIKLNLNLSRLDIAALLGITQETSIRLLKSFKDAGIIDIKRKEIIIKSLPMLESVIE